MGKQPAFQFYPGDWTRDLDDQDLEIEGAWIRIICRLWWSDTPGEATKTIREWARILRKTEKKTREIFQILIEKHIASGDLLLNQKDNQTATIICRRMVSDWRISQIRKEVGKLGGNPSLFKKPEILDNQSSNQKPTPSSSSSSSSSSNLNIKEEEREESPPFPSVEIKEPKKKTIPPLIDDVKVYCQERKNNIDPEAWMAYYNSNGWMVGKNKMRDWKAAIITWEKRGGDGRGQQQTNNTRGDRSQTPREIDQPKEWLGTDIPSDYEETKQRNIKSLHAFADTFSKNHSL